MSGDELGTVQLWDYSVLNGNSQSQGPGAGDGYGGGGGGPSVEVASEEAQANIGNVQLTLLAVIQHPGSGNAASVTHIAFHPTLPLLLGVFGRAAMHIYDLSAASAGVSEAVATGSMRSGVGRDRDKGSTVLKLDPIARSVPI